MAFEIEDETGAIFKDGEYFAHMGIARPHSCLRGCTDCMPLASMVTKWGDEAKDRAFICIGENDGTNRVWPGDELRHCFKNDVIDTTEDWDRRDVVDTVSVLMQGLSMHDNMRLNAEADKQIDQ